MYDKAKIDLTEIVRYRQWDSCQDQHFAEVHSGNFRSTRKARLRQFVCHKLSYWVSQHGCFGCVGCGRCIHWCPTGIDLTEIAAEIREDATQ
jgi:ferredoxin